MQKRSEQNAAPVELIESDAVSWWSWRPGMKPLWAFLFGGLLSLLALFLLSNGVLSLLSDILNSSEPPLRVPGVVVTHSQSGLGTPQLTIHLEKIGFPSTITLLVSSVASTALTDGAAVIVDYGPHLHTPYALESSGRNYTLPGTSSSGNLFESLTLLLSGLVLLPYPLLLFLWGWRDLHLGRTKQLTGYVVALRAARQTTRRSPGMVPRTTGTWYGVALQAEDADINARVLPLLTLGIRREIYEQLQRGDKIQVTYSPHLHHLYALKRL
ncbi:MAG TPA: hypothetical protein VFN35_31470 [Ktedonobacteraceae bacterium]|nr:hypothetical protein [Ktedonobacteraceae bacterium]